MRPRDLIDQSRRLIESSPRRPRDVDLRRAVSGGYYALFHAIAKAGAELVVGSNGAQRSQSAWNQVYRSLEHGHAKSQSATLPAGFSQELFDVADAFVALQKLRHSADYDPSATFTLQDVKSHVLQAERAIEQFSASLPKDRRAFVVWLLFRKPRA